VLAYFKFKALLAGDCPVVADHVDIRDSNNDPATVTTTGGIVHILGPTPVAKTTWGRVKSIYR
jgi:hypothetical protein